jgi:uncharacterized membrane protein YoaK (UPF0700 family)
MWNTNTLWFEVALVSAMYALGHIFFGHFEERTSKWRKLLKYLLTLTVVVCISLYAGRIYSIILLIVSLLPVIYIHAFLLPKRGINGWTGEPKSHYYDFRGWDKNIF